MKINIKKTILHFSITSALLLNTVLCFGSVRAFLDYKVFFIPENGPFLETILEFDGNSLNYKPIEGTTQDIATVQVTIIIQQGEKVVDFQKINISSQVKEVGSLGSDFMDIRRFSLPNGTYNLELQLLDLNDPDAEEQILEQEITIDIDPSLPYVSDITFIKAYSPASTETELTKSGYDILPYVDSYFPSDVQRLAFYAEVYNADKVFGINEKYALTYFVTNEETQEIAENLQRYERIDSKPASALFQILDISSLGEGNYRLHIEMRDKQNNSVVSRGLSFYRDKISDPSLASSDTPMEFDVENTFVMQFNDADVLREHIESCWPIMTTIERNAVQFYLGNADISILRSYFYTLWERRNPESPEAGWNEYAEQVVKVQSAYGTRVKKGYQTDRGRVYLQYGEPNTIVRRHNDLDAYPYEIWHYYKIARFNNKKFLFYNPDLVTNDFALLHSDVTGEVRNDQWVNQVLQRNNHSSGPDSPTVINGASRVLIDLWNNPR